MSDEFRVSFIKKRHHYEKNASAGLKSAALQYKVLDYRVTFYSFLLKYCFPWSETIVNMLHVGKNKLLECLSVFIKSLQRIVVKLNSSPEPETHNTSVCHQRG